MSHRMPPNARRTWTRARTAIERLGYADFSDNEFLQQHWALGFGTPGGWPPPRPRRLPPVQVLALAYLDAGDRTRPISIHGNNDYMESVLWHPERAPIIVGAARECARRLQMVNARALVAVVAGFDEAGQLVYIEAEDVRPIPQGAHELEGLRAALRGAEATLGGVVATEERRMATSWEYGKGMPLNTPDRRREPLPGRVVTLAVRWPEKDERLGEKVLQVSQEAVQQAVHAPAMAAHLAFAVRESTRRILATDSRARDAVAAVIAERGVEIIESSMLPLVTARPGKLPALMN